MALANLNKIMAALNKLKIVELKGMANLKKGMVDLNKVKTNFDKIEKCISQQDKS